MFTIHIWREIGCLQFDVFWDENVLGDIVMLKDIAQTVLQLIERMENIQKIGWKSEVLMVYMSRCPCGVDR